jgi:hypothetical protein
MKTAHDYATEIPWRSIYDNAWNHSDGLFKVAQATAERVLLDVRAEGHSAGSPATEFVILDRVLSDLRALQSMGVLLQDLRIILDRLDVPAGSLASVGERESPKI